MKKNDELAIQILEKNVPKYILDTYDLKFNDRFIVAVKANDFTMVKLLVERGANVNYTDSNKNKPLLLASKLGNKEMLDFLINRGATLN